MSLNNWPSVILNEFRGRYNRDNDVLSIPPGYSPIAENVIFDRLNSRPGFTLSTITPTNLPNLPPQLFLYKTLRLRQVQFTSESDPRLLGLLWCTDSLLLPTVNRIVLYDLTNDVLLYNFGDIGFDVDFNTTILFDRVYVSAYTRTTGKGLSEQKLLVFEYGKLSTVTLAAGGAGYAVNDILSIVDDTGRNGTVKVTGVAAGVITTFTVETNGTKYTVENGLTSTAVTGTGTGATFNVTAVTASARLAAGSAPSGFTLTVATSATAGTVETGRHLFAVAYETDSGFITAPGPTSWTLFNVTTANRKIDLSNIPIGPAGTVARHILMSKIIHPYVPKKFNQLEWELFFIPNGRIADNTRTTFTIDALDSQLISSADYLIDQLATIPCGPIIETFNARLISGGEAKSAAGATITGDVYTLRASTAGSPESFNSVNGFTAIAPDDKGGALFAAKEDRGAIYVFKQDRTYVGTDTDPAIINWRFDIVDGSVGALPDGVSQMLDSKGASSGGLLVVHESGLRKLNGIYEEIPLSLNIEADWPTTIGNDTNNSIATQILIDPSRKSLFLVVKEGIVTPSAYVGNYSPVLYGDYRDGLTPEGIKWSWWYLPFSHVTGTRFLYFSGTVGSLTLAFSSETQSSVKIGVLDWSAVIESNSIVTYCWHPISFSPSQGKSQLHAIRSILSGRGSTGVGVFDENFVGVPSMDGGSVASITLSSSIQTFLRFYNHIANHLLFYISMIGNGTDNLKVYRLLGFGNEYSEEDPA